MQTPVDERMLVQRIQVKRVVRGPEVRCAAHSAAVCATEKAPQLGTNVVAAMKSALPNTPYRKARANNEMERTKSAHLPRTAAFAAHLGRCADV